MITNIGTAASYLRTNWNIQSMDAQMNQLTNEVSSGIKTDIAGSAGTNASLVYALEYLNDQQTALKTTITTAGQRLDTMQTAMSNISSITTTLSAASLNQAATVTSSGRSVLATQAQSALAQVADLLNTQYDGHAVFAGDATNGVPLADSSTITTAADTILQNAIAANGGQPLDSAQIAGLVGTNNSATGTDGLGNFFSSTPVAGTLSFSAATNGAAVAGSTYTVADDGQPIKVMIGQSQTVSYNVKANQQAFTDLMKGLTMLGMLGAPSSQITDAGKQTLLNQASTLLENAQSELTVTAGNLGTVQQALTNAASIQQSASDATQQQILQYTQTDMSTDATKLNELQLQLQATYQITASISKLSLSNYLNGVL
jgi:flagellar hook-associated protein 3 FlgL